MRQLFRGIGLVCAALSLSACVALITPKVTTERAELKQGAYALDKAHAAVLFKVSHFGFSSYVGRFNAFDATLDFDPQDPEAAALEVLVEIDSIDVGDADFSEKLAGSGWLNGESHPQARFASTSIEVTGPTTGTVAGDFTLNGVTNPLTLEVTFIGGGLNRLTRKQTLGFAATGSFLRSDHGVDALIPAIGDEVELEIHVEFQKVG